MSKKRVALSPDVLAVVESTNPKMVRFYETATGKALNYTIEHTLPTFTSQRSTKTSEHLNWGQYATHLCGMTNSTS